MAIEFEKKPIPWKAPGSMPSDELQTSGFQAGYKPAAQTFNALFNNTSECLTELQDSVSGIDTELEDFVRVAHSEEIPSTPILTDSNLLEGQPASYYTNASNMTSGVLSVENGGTGATTPSGALSNLNGVEKTTRELKYYVNASTGSDTNDGLTSSTPFATIQHAVDILPKQIDHKVTIQLAPGTYDKVTIRGFGGGASLAITGSTNTQLSRANDAVNYVINGVNVTRNQLWVALEGIMAVPSINSGTDLGTRAIVSEGGAYVLCDGCRVTGTDGSGTGFATIAGGGLQLRWCGAYDIETGVGSELNGRVMVNAMHGSGVSKGYRATDGGMIQEGNAWGVSGGYSCTTKYSSEGSGLIIKQDGSLA